MFSLSVKSGVAALLVMAATVVFAQGNQQARVIGVVTEKQGSGAKVKTDAGEVYSVVFAPQTKFQKIAPGQTSLKDAETIGESDISDGDRVLARGTSTDPKTIVALSVILMSKTDLAAKQQKDRQDWTRRGVAGTVTAVNPAGKTITIKLPQLGTTDQLVTVTPKPEAPLRRYSADSVKFADAKIAPLTDVKPGDQLRARGEKSEDGKSFTADEIVSGSFQTLAGTVVAVDAGTGEVQIKNIDNNKPMTVKVTADAAIKRLPEGGGFGGGVNGPGGGGGFGGGNRSEGGARPEGAARAEGGQRPEGAPGGPGGQGQRAGGGPGAGGPGGGGRGPDLARILEMLPPSTLADVKPGETIIVAGTKGAATDKVTAITLLANAQRFVDMRRAMAARAQAAGGGQGSSGPVTNWNLGEMSIPAP